MCPDRKAQWFGESTGYTTAQRNKIKKAALAYFKDHYFTAVEAPPKSSGKQKVCV